MMNTGAEMRVADKPASPPRLAEAGIDKNLADRRSGTRQEGGNLYVCSIGRKRLYAET